MARNRMIKPEFWASESLMRVSIESRLMFIGVWNFCDDYGFCLNNARQIFGNIFPVDNKVTEKDVASWLVELIKIEVLIPLEYQGKKLLFVKSWGEHQTVQHKSKRSFIESDDLEEVIKDTLESHESLLRVYLESHAPKRKLKKKEKEKVKEESNKEKHLDCLHFTQDELVNLSVKFGSIINREEGMVILNNYKMTSGKTYKSDYHAMVGWVHKKFASENPGKIDDPDQFSNDIGLIAPQMGGVEVDLSFMGQ